MTELEKKLNKLEIYCHNLKSGLDEALSRALASQTRSCVPSVGKSTSGSLSSSSLSMSRSTLSRRTRKA
ncbi:BnaC05g08530D [Brassica napus]|uniref:BnaC05g08530D protein n=1 Tax=Brassica napus TaxID=3708 RepID=A0A078G1J4_BRANA|nr:BnaC05g08530D [Brassica napus]